jgi:hypothetical protein
LSVTWLIGLVAVVALFAAIFLGFVGGVGLLLMFAIGIGLAAFMRRSTRRSSPS